MRDLFFPRKCYLCGKPVGDGPVICRDCMENMPRTEQAANRNNLTEALFCDIPKFVRGAVFLFLEYGDKYHKLIHEMKYGRFADPHIGYLLGKEAAYEFMPSEFFDEIDVILPVPLHPRRLRERGFNQAEWIGKGLSEVTGIAMEPTLLTRERNNKQQAQTDKTARQQNVAGIFSVNHPEELYHKHILLVDDVITTGSTLRSCMEALKPVRDHKVSVFGLGKVR